MRRFLSLLVVCAGCVWAQSGVQSEDSPEFARAEVRPRFVKQMAEDARAEEALESSLNQSPEDAPVLADRYDGDGVFSMVAFSKVESEFEKHFGKPLPVSAMGDTAVHRSLCFDHL